MCAVFTFVVQLSLLHIFLVISSAVDQTKKNIVLLLLSSSSFPVCFFILVNCCLFFFLCLTFVCVCLTTLAISHDVVGSLLSLFTPIALKMMLFLFFNFFLSWRSSMLLVGCFSRSSFVFRRLLFCPAAALFYFIYTYI